MRYFHFCAHEQFPPDDLLRQAVEAEEAGFDGIGCSDHLQPWWEPGESGHAWVWLGAAAQATEQVPIGTGVTPPGPRYHPVLIAQAWATLETMFPGRPYLGFGSGESLNESPLGAEWPPVGEQIDRMGEGLGGGAKRVPGGGGGAAGGRADRPKGGGARAHPPFVRGRACQSRRPALPHQGPPPPPPARAAPADLRFGLRASSRGGGRAPGR